MRLATIRATASRNPPAACCERDKTGQTQWRQEVGRRPGIDSIDSIEHVPRPKAQAEPTVRSVGV